MKIKNQKNKKKGFTLIELIIVIAILAILAMLAIPRFGQIRQNANRSNDIANAKTIANAVTTLIADGDITPVAGGLAFDIDDAVADPNGDLVEDFLQNVPTSLLQNDVFDVTIDANGNVQVASNGTQYFPAP